MRLFSDRFVPLFREKDLHVLVDRLGNGKLEEFEARRLKKMNIVLLLLLAWPLSGYHIGFLLLLLLAALFVYKESYFKLKRMQKKLLVVLRHEFPLWLRQLQILLQNNNVLASLKLSYEKAPLLIKSELSSMIDGIEKDAIGIGPYISFMDDFKIYEIQKAMKLLYRYHFVGAEESYQQFHRMIEATSKWLRVARNEKKTQRLYILQWLGMIPLFGVTMMFMVMMVVVILEMMKGGGI